MFAHHMLCSVTFSGTSVSSQTVTDHRAHTYFHRQKKPVQKKNLSMPLDKGLNRLPAKELHLIVVWVQPMAGIHTAHRRSVGPWGVAMSFCLGM